MRYIWWATRIQRNHRGRCGAPRRRPGLFRSTSKESGLRCRQNGKRTSAKKKNIKIQNEKLMCANFCRRWNRKTKNNSILNSNIDIIHQCLPFDTRFRIHPVDRNVSDSKNVSGQQNSEKRNSVVCTRPFVYAMGRLCAGILSQLRAWTKPAAASDPSSTRNCINCGDCTYTYIELKNTSQEVQQLHDKLFGDQDGASAATNVRFSLFLLLRISKYIHTTVVTIIFWAHFEDG